MKQQSVCLKKQKKKGKKEKPGLLSRGVGGGGGYCVIWSAVMFPDNTVIMIHSQPCVGVSAQDCLEILYAYVTPWLWCLQRPQVQTVGTKAAWQGLQPIREKVWTSVNKANSKVVGHIIMNLKKTFTCCHSRTAEWGQCYELCYSDAIWQDSVSPAHCLVHASQTRTQLSEYARRIPLRCERTTCYIEMMRG